MVNINHVIYSSQSQLLIAKTNEERTTHRKALLVGTKTRKEREFWSMSQVRRRCCPLNEITYIRKKSTALNWLLTSSYTRVDNSFRYLYFPTCTLYTCVSVCTVYIHKHMCTKYMLESCIMCVLVYNVCTCTLYTHYTQVLVHTYILNS